MDRRTFLRWLGSAGAGAAVGAVGGRVLDSPVAAAAAADDTPKRFEVTDGTASRVALGTHQIIWSVTTDKPFVALTFDDGPDPEFTPKVLAMLDRFGARATFNVMGWNALKHPELLKATVSAGHEIGNHTWSHRDLAYESPANTLRQLRAGRAAIEDVIETPIRFLRPPRGELTGAAARGAAELDYDILLWSVTRGPAGVSTPQAVTASVLSHISPGAILDMHDGIGRGTFNPNGAEAKLLRARRRVEMEALPGILAGAKSRGITFTTASQLVAASSA